MPRSLWLSRDCAKILSLASSMARRRRRAKGSRTSGSAPSRVAAMDSTAMLDATSLAAQPHEGPIRAPEVEDGHAPGTLVQLGVAPGEEFVVGEHHVALLAPEGDLAAGEVEDVAARARGGDLAQAAPGRLGRRTEKH